MQPLPGRPSVAPALEWHIACGVALLDRLGSCVRSDPARLQTRAQTGRGRPRYRGRHHQIIRSAVDHHLLVGFDRKALAGSKKTGADIGEVRTGGDGACEAAAITDATPDNDVAVEELAHRRDEGE